MLKIAVCDDNQEDLARIVSVLDEYLAAKADRYQVTYTQYNNAVDLLYAMERGQSFDVILLDIIMPFTTGMDAAKEIRGFNREVKIVFLTSSSEYAVESYSVHAFFYMLKPVEKTSLYSMLDRVLSEIEGQPHTGFVLKSKTGLVRIQYNKLEYAEVIGRTIIYHFTDGSVYEAIGSMTVLEGLLSEVGFIKPHRSYIINMAYIERIRQGKVTMQSQAVVPVSKVNLGPIKTAYMEFAFHNMNHPREHI